MLLAWLCRRTELAEISTTATAILDFRLGPECQPIRRVDSSCHRKKVSRNIYQWWPPSWILGPDGQPIGRMGMGVVSVDF